MNDNCTIEARVRRRRKKEKNKKNDIIDVIVDFTFL